MNGYCKKEVPVQYGLLLGRCFALVEVEVLVADGRNS